MHGHQVPPTLPSPYNSNNPGGIPPAATPHPSMPTPYSYFPPPPPPPLISSAESPEQTKQKEKQTRQYQEPQKPPQPRPGDRSRNIGKDSESAGGNAAQLSSSASKSSNAKNNPPPRLPPTATRRGSGNNNVLNRDIGNSYSHPPPPLPASSPYHLRADSYGSMSSLGSQGYGSASFSKDEGDDYLQNYTQSSQTVGADNQKDVNVSTPKANRRQIDTSSAMNDPETPQQKGHERKNSFLDMLRMNWSPQSRNSPTTRPKQLKVNEFHRKNQEFLNGLPPIQKSSSASSLTGMTHRRVGSEDRPPASRGTHRRLQSISNDEWSGDDKSPDDTDSGEMHKEMPAPSADLKRNQAPKRDNTFKSSESDGMSDFGEYTDEDRFTTDDDLHDDYGNMNELTSLLPPSGISSNEQEGKNPKYDRKSRRGSRQQYDATSSTRRKEHKRSESNDFGQILTNMSVSEDSSANITSMSESTSATLRWDNRAGNMARKGRKKKYRYKNAKYSSTSGTGSSSESSQESSDSDFDHRKWAKKRTRMLEKERAKLIEQWKAEAREEAELSRKQEEANRWYRRFWRSISEQMRDFGVTTFRFLTLVENFIGNLPLTIGAVALAIVTLGVVWFKFAEEYLDTCEPVHFHSSQCTFPEFPGCFYCDRSALGYKIAVGFHYACTIVSGLLAMLLVAKILLATRVVVDEMSSPTTSSPAGLLCMTAVCVFAGRGVVGEVIVSTAACIHLALAIWFIYMALAYNIMPEPSWFPNTIGIGLSAVKVNILPFSFFRLDEMINSHHFLSCVL